jgi:3-oxoacyl-[acyl-carrier-protein] synthase-1
MTSIYLIGASLLTPLGADPVTVTAAMDAGISGYQYCEILGEGDEPLQFSPVPEEALKVRLAATLPGLSPPQIRLLKLATFALADIAPQLPEAPVPLFLAGPEPYYYPPMLTPLFTQHLMKSAGVTLDTRSSRTITTGRAGAIQAIEIAFRYFEATGAPYALVGGVDTFYNPRTLDILDNQKRLAGKGFDGFVPGEGAAFMLLASPSAPEAASRQSLLRLHRSAVVHEPGHLLGSAPYTAEALASACAAAMANAQAHGAHINDAGARISTIYSSENGEMHYNKELTVATLRNQDRLSKNRTIIRPAEFLGDLGAAFAPVAITLASAAAAPTKGLNSLVCASSDGGPRGAICLSPV